MTCRYPSILLSNVKRLTTFDLIDLQCEHIPGLGFRRGSYRCECKDGFYYPDKNSPVHYYNGTVIEEEYEKKLMVSLALIA